MRCTLALLVVVAACSNGKQASPSSSTPAATGHGSSSAPVVADASSTDAIATFWSWFVANAADLRADTDLGRTMNRISDQLEQVNRGVFAEIAKNDKTLTLVISADGNRELFPIVQDVYARRPTVEGWTIVAFRPRADPSLSLELGDVKVVPREVKFVAERAGSKLDVRVYIPGYTGTDPMKQVGFLVLDHTVGEYDMETRIGGVEFDSVAHAPRDARPLTDLPAAVDALK